MAAMRSAARWMGIQTNAPRAGPCRAGPRVRRRAPRATVGSRRRSHFGGRSQIPLPDQAEEPFPVEVLVRLDDVDLRSAASAFARPAQWTMKRSASRFGCGALPATSGGTTPPNTRRTHPYSRSNQLTSSPCSCRMVATNPAFPTAVGDRSKAGMGA